MLHLGGVRLGAGARACACGSVGLGIDRLGNIRALALPVKAPAVVGAHDRAVARLYAPLCMTRPGNGDSWNSVP